MLILPREKFICLTFVAPCRKNDENEGCTIVSVRLFVFDGCFHAGVMTTMKKLCLV